MKSAAEMRTAAVLGAGTMGAGIAQVTAQAGLATTLYDITEELARKGLARVEKSLAGLVEKGKMTAEERQRILGLITPSADVAAASRGADVVVEAAPERSEVKKGLFQAVERSAPDDALLASNTSSLSITSLASALGTPSRFLGLHFFNPPPVMKLLEIVRGERTSDEAVATARALALRLGKDPIVVKDSPGFASSRLGLVIGLEAMRMLEDGVATAEDIDKAMELGYRHPMGPLKLTDLVGLDVRLEIADHLARTISASRFGPPDILRRLVEQGHLGKKTGRGFYDWSSGEPKLP
jgi:3-hydroxybutyryl-CoA dehydrogenase